MTGYDIIADWDLLSGLLHGQDGLAKLVETVLNQTLGTQMTESWG